MITFNQSKNYLLLFTLFVLIHTNLFSQKDKVGVVFSGGGAAGYAHIGVLKALEDNHIPVDYIAGTSQGALIGAMYAIGLTPTEIQTLVETETYKNMAVAAIEEKYAYYFKREDKDPSWLTLKLSIDSSLRFRFPTNVRSPISLDLGMMEFTTGPSAASNYNYDSLFVPYRCVAADIEKKEPVVFKKGDLGEGVRASISYPFFIPPVIVDGKLLFDGGLYNNFPSNVMYDDFYPDFIVGSTVAGNSKSPNEDDVFSQIKSMLVTKTNFNALCENGIIIKPKTNVSLFDFNNPQPTIDSGYAATMRQMDFIKEHVTRRVDSTELYTKRANFRNKIPKIVYDKIYIEGLNSKQSQYARSILRHKKKQISLEDMKTGYFRLAADSKIKYIYPKSRFNPETGFYDLYLKIKKERDIVTYVGGNFSNRPISEGYLGVQYNYMSEFATAVMANAYFGKLYSSVQVKTRLDFPFKTPIFLQPSFTWNKWDYYSSSNDFLTDVKPAYLKQNEQYGDVIFGFPTGNKARIVLGGGGGRITDKYYQTSNFTVEDTADRTDFDMFTAQAFYEINTLNRKQYANQGENFNFKVRYVTGVETNTPGSTSDDTLGVYRKSHQWITLKVKGEKYFNRKGTLKIGLFGEGVYSTQELFHNYTSSVLSAPAFQPTPDTRTLFLENYRAYQYAAAGLRFVVNFRENIELRAEGYIFQPVQTLEKTNDLKTVYGNLFTTQHYIATGAIVWNTPVGPMSFSVNYYDHQTKPFSVLFHFGYILFNNRALEE